MTPLYKNQQIRQLENLCFSQDIINPVAMMAGAGAALWRVLQQFWLNISHIAVVCGKGNNAGDGFVVAKLAHEAGIHVDVYTLASINTLQGAAKKHAILGLEAGLNYIEYKPDFIFTTDLIIDAVLGSGLQGDVRGLSANAIQSINASDAAVLAVDVPSGIDVDTGAILGNAVQADVTVTFIAAKQGLFTDKASAYCGELIIDSLNVPEHLFAEVTPSAEILAYAETKTWLPKRRRDSHKGDYGHVLVIGGDYGMGGAVRMAAEAAMRVGAGLVSVATRPEHVSVVSSTRPEIMCHQVASHEDLLPLLAHATVIIIGPGLGKSEWAQHLLSAVLKTDKPKVLDADALNLLSLQPKPVPNSVITPHPGEASRLLNVSCQDVQDDRFAAARNLQQRYEGVVVLKGVGTIISGPDQCPCICPAGNPGMASGGMGDVLSGVIGGLLSQQLSSAIAAKTGVLVHSMAADLAAEEGGERGLLATDLLAHLRALVNPHE